MPSLQPTQELYSQLLATPQDLWDLVLPKSAVNAASFDPGQISDVAHTGTGQGLLQVTDLPYDGYRVNVRVTQSGNTIATMGTVAVTRVGASTGTITLDGTPAGTYQGLIQIMSTGGPGAAQFRYSLNNGASWSVNTVVPQSLIFAMPLTGLRLFFHAGAGPTVYEAGDLHSFTTTGLAKVVTSLFTVPFVEREGTGLVLPLGMPTRPYRVNVHFLQAGTLGSGAWRYNVNGGAFGQPQAIPAGGTFDIPGTGITLSFDPGPGPVFFGAPDVQSFRTWGTSAPLTIGSDPIPLSTPVDTGLRLNFVPYDPAAGVNFAAGDVYSFSTTASRDILGALQAASDVALTMLAERYSRPLLNWDQSIVQWVCDIARLALFTRKGLSLKEDKSYITAAHRAEQKLDAVGQKKLHPLIVESSPKVFVPAVYLGPDDHGILEGSENGGGP